MRKSEIEHMVDSSKAVEDSKQLGTRARSFQSLDNFCFKNTLFVKKLKCSNVYCEVFLYQQSDYMFPK